MGWEFGVSSVQSLSRVQLFVTPWTAAHQASLSITNSQSLPKLMSIESVMPTSHLIVCHPLLLLPPISPCISLFQWVNSSHEVAKVLEFQLQHQSFQWTPRTISFRMDWLVGVSRCKLLHIEWISNKVLLGSSVNYTQYREINER